MSTLLEIEESDDTVNIKIPKDIVMNFMFLLQTGTLNVDFLAFSKDEKKAYDFAMTLVRFCGKEL